MKTVMDMVFNDENVPDFGSIRMCSRNVYNVREYTLLAADKAKLNLITNAASGSKAYCTDSKELLMYNESDNTWYPV